MLSSRAKAPPTAPTRERADARATRGARRRVDGADADVVVARCGEIARIAPRATN
jgi:Asp/Glu/hydantoin racemase